MKKIITFIPFFILSFFFLTIFLFNAKDVFAVSCTKIGNSTYCSDGTTYNQIGNTLYGSNGSTYNRIGNTTYGSGGSSCTKIGSSTYCSDGTTYNQIGNSLYGSDGSSYNKIGSTIYGNGGNAVSSCPANSSYDSLSGNCKCNYGYVVSGSSCIYKITNYSNPSTYSANSYNCPLNSHTSTTDPTKCQCNSGYQVNLAKTACVLTTTNTTINNNQACINAYGLNSYWDGTKTVAGLLNCGCKIGYQWNQTRTQCVFILK
ncbi:MAG: hypothetical protein NTV36_01875 [Candidatus Staskawiczbacteria bacterium]|nr:hypothetical protein [Candidatus Staskawiczbacteria bacterium]